MEGARKGEPIGGEKKCPMGPPPDQSTRDAPDQEGGPAEAQELPENDGEAQGKAGKLSGGVQAADKVLPELKGNSESCGHQLTAVGCQGGQGMAVQGPAGRKRSWLLEELKLAGGQCTGGERECALLRAAAGWSPFRWINCGGAQRRIKEEGERCK